MGLDNIPHKYPCKTQGTAVLDDEGRIMCDETIACDGCPWKKALGDKKGAIGGIFGTYCWYRGKSGNYLLGDNLGIDPNGDLSFYGDQEDGTYKTPESCVELAEAMEDAVAEYGIQFTEDYTDEDKAHTKENIEYAIAWLKWVASECEGSTAWY